MELSRRVFPNEPITRVEGTALSPRFDAMLKAHSGAPGEWGIIYNKSIRSPGRINFSLAHELGHYILHRAELAGSGGCGNTDAHVAQSPPTDRETEANTFASHFLMPLDDFQEQIDGGTPSWEFMSALADRYEVSLETACLKWIEVTPQRAMIVRGIEGFIDWTRSSTALLKSGVFYRAKQKTIRLPEKALASGHNSLGLSSFGTATHPPGVWIGDEEVRELTKFSHFDETTLTILLYPNDVRPRQA